MRKHTAHKKISAWGSSTSVLHIHLPTCAMAERPLVAERRCIQCHPWPPLHHPRGHEELPTSPQGASQECSFNLLVPRQEEPLAPMCLPFSTHPIPLVFSSRVCHIVADSEGIWQEKWSGYYICV